MKVDNDNRNWELSSKPALVWKKEKVLSDLSFCTQHIWQHGREARGPAGEVSAKTAPGPAFLPTYKLRAGFPLVWFGPEERLASASLDPRTLAASSSSSCRVFLLAALTPPLVPDKPASGDWCADCVCRPAAGASGRRWPFVSGETAAGRGSGTVTDGPERCSAAAPDPWAVPGNWWRLF